jgi:beta-glucosidase
LQPGESRTVRFDVPAERLAHWSPERNAYHLEPGTYEFAVGRSSIDLPATASYRIGS